MKWQPIETAPRDNTPILINIKYQFVFIGVWNEVSGNWCYANFGVDQFHGKWIDTYFEPEYVDEKEIKGWMPLPEIKKEKKNG